MANLIPTIIGVNERTFDRQYQMDLVKRYGCLDDASQLPSENRSVHTSIKFGNIPDWLFDRLFLLAHDHDACSHCIPPRFPVQERPLPPPRSKYPCLISRITMFGCVLPGRPLLTRLTQVDETHACFELGDGAGINHVCVFMLGTGAPRLSFTASRGPSISHLTPETGVHSQCLFQMAMGRRCTFSYLARAIKFWGCEYASRCCHCILVWPKLKLAHGLNPGSRPRSPRRSFAYGARSPWAAVTVPRPHSAAKRRRRLVGVSFLDWRSSLLSRSRPQCPPRRHLRQRRSRAPRRRASRRPSDGTWLTT
jgi:hypothetical protein